MQHTSVYAARNQRRLLLGAPTVQNFAAQFLQEGLANICAKLKAWAASYRATNPAAADWSMELDTCGIFRSEQFLGDHVVVELRSLQGRNELCRQLAMAPARAQDFPALRVTARLTSNEERNRKAVIPAFQVPPEDPNDRRVNRPFLPGNKVQLLADIAVVVIEGNTTDLGLPLA